MQDNDTPGGPWRISGRLIRPGPPTAHIIAPAPFQLPPALSQIPAAWRSRHEHIDFSISFFQCGNPFFTFFEIIFSFTDSGLFFLLRFPVQPAVGCGGSGGRHRHGSVKSGSLNFGGIRRRSGILFFQIIIVVADVVHKLLRFQLQYPAGSLINEITVMGHIQHGPLITVQGVLQNFLGDDIQVVGWFIQDQEIGIAQHQLGQGDPSSFPAAQIFNPLKDIITRKQKSG